MEAQEIAADSGFITFVLGISGAVIVLLLSIIGFFLARIISDVKSNTQEIGKNKGKIELVDQQQRSDTKRIEELTQLELKTMSENVSELSGNVNSLVQALAQKGIDQI